VSRNKFVSSSVISFTAFLLVGLCLLGLMS
jgi:hypothetical protein